MTDLAGSIELDTPLSAQITVHKNIEQDVIVVSEDKLRLCLQRHEKRLSASGDWITPAGLLFTVLSTLISAEFKEVIFPSATWKTLFVIVAAISVYRAIFALIARYKARNDATIDCIVTELKATRPS